MSIKYANISYGNRIKAADAKLSRASRRLNLALDPFRDGQLLTFEEMEATFGEKPVDFRGITVRCVHRSSDKLVVHCVFKDHAGIGPHKHDCHEEIYLVKGDFRSNNGGEHKLSPGEKVSIPPRVVHRSWSERGAEVIVTFSR